jgi:uncharacterized membrane protein SpoIIM required for sporulation/ABC-type transport system involved in multi-copper enzyme maturation permease subunit
MDNIWPAFVIARREVRDQLRDWRIIFPVLGLTIFFPFLMNFTAKIAEDFVKQYGASLIADRLVPFLLMIVGFFPISVSLVIALETFVGEKERGSIEPLLNTPLKDWQLYLGKLLAATVPPLFSSFIGMTVYLSGLKLQNIAIPELPLLFQIFTITIVQAVLMVSGAVVVSSQATSVRAANLLASFIIIPIALLIQAESVVMFWGNYQTLWLVVFGLVVLTVLFVRVGLAHFQREELLGREIDVLNLRFAWSVFKRSFTGKAKNLKDWYLTVLPETVRLLGKPAVVMVILLGVAVYLGTLQEHTIPPNLLRGNKGLMDTNLQDLIQAWPMFSIAPVLSIWWQNVRVLLLSMVLGIFSFGVVGVIPSMATFAILGYLAGIFASQGIPVAYYILGFIAPHGLIEIPAIVLAGAAVIRMGAILATPTPNRTIGEVWISCLADWFKVMLGAVIPMLLVSAAIEAWITPQIALLLFH